MGTLSVLNVISIFIYQMLRNPSSSPKIYCQQHPRQQVIHICLHPPCTNLALLCVRCMTTTHKDHQTLSTDEFLQKLNNLHFDSSIQSLAITSKTILKQIKINLLEGLGELRLKLNEQLQRTERAVAEWLEDEERKMRAHAERFGDCVRGMGLEQPDIADKEKVKGYLGCLEVKRRVEAGYYEQINRIQEKGANQYQILSMIQAQLTDSFKMLTIVSEAQKICEQEPQANTGMVSWSPDLKHPDIKISGSIAKRNQITNQGNQVLIIAIPNQQNPILKWKVKINAQSGANLIGMCLLSMAQRNKFTYESVSGTGHGYYVLSNYGWMASHAELMTQTEIHFTYGIGDVLTLEFDSVKQTLTISKSQTAKVVVKIEKVPQGDHLLPCVCLGIQNDAVQLLP